MMFYSIDMDGYEKKKFATINQARKTASSIIIKNWWDMVDNDGVIAVYKHSDSKKENVGYVLPSDEYDKVCAWMPRKTRMPTHIVNKDGSIREA